MAYLPRRLLQIDNRRIAVRELVSALSMSIALLAVMSQAPKDNSSSAVHELLIDGTKSLQNIDISSSLITANRHTNIQES